MRFRHQLLSTALILCIFASLFAPQPARAQTVPDPDTASIDAYIASVREAIHIPGVALTIVNRQGAVYTQAYGDAGPNRPTTIQTPFWIASLSKPFTALAARQLINAGLLDEYAPVQRYIPWFTLADPNRSERITVRELINHTSGIPGSAGGEVYFNAKPNDTNQDLIQQLKNIQPNSVIAAEYSNYNYIILGHIIEVVSGQSYAAYIQEHVLSPLGMTHTYFNEPEARANGGVNGYKLIFNRPVVWDETYKPSMQSAGYIISSIEDMAKLATLYLNDGLVNGVNLLGQNAPTGEGFYDIYWNWNDFPAGINDIPTHEGAMQTNGSAIRIYPGRDIALVVLLNIRPDWLYNNMKAVDVLDNVTAIVMGSTPNPPNDRGYARKVSAFLNQMAIYSAVLVISLVLTLIWRQRRLRSGWARILAVIGAVLELALAGYGAIGLPLMNHTGWKMLLTTQTDEYGLVLFLSVLFLFSGLFKLFSLLVSPNGPAVKQPGI